MVETQKDTIYVDVDDEITSVIEKLRGAKHKIVALVLPKRATVLQSIVNMKLLKRTAEEENKKLVLITSEASLLPLAGAVGVHVAKTLQSKPTVPKPPEVAADKEMADVDEDSLDDTKSIGELSGDEEEPPAKVSSPEETINIDDIDDEPGPKKKSKKSKVKVPNFEKFRLKLIFAAIGTAIFIVFLFFALKVWPKATITIKTNSTTIDTNFDFTASTDAQSVNTATNTVPAVQKESEKTNSQKVAATGEKNVGENAAGTVIMTKSTNCITPVGTIPSGTTVTGAGQAFTSQSQATFAGPPTIQSGKCVWTSNSVNVKAQNPGTASNLSSGTQFSVSGYNATATNSNAFTGGTDKNITVVSQKDIDDAKKKAVSNDSEAKKDLNKQFEDDNLLPLTVSILPGKQTVSSSAKVGDEATEVTVTVDTTYTMLGVKQSDLAQLVEEEAKSSIDKKNQEISDDGLKNATFTVKSKKSPNVMTISVETKASTGAKIDTDKLKTEIAGKKKGDVESIVQALPGVESVDVNFSPFWVNKVPSNPSKITINVENVQASNESNNGN